MKDDRQLLVLTHLSQLLDLVTGCAGFIVPLVVWLTQKDRILNMDTQGKAIINFQISMFVYAIICIPLTFLFGLGALGLLVIGVLCFVFPIINAIKASKGEDTSYPLTIQFFK